MVRLVSVSDPVYCARRSFPELVWVTTIVPFPVTDPDKVYAAPTVSFVPEFTVVPDDPGVSFALKLTPEVFAIINPTGEMTVLIAWGDAPVKVTVRLLKFLVAIVYWDVKSFVFPLAVTFTTPLPIRVPAPPIVFDAPGIRTDRNPKT